MSLVAIASLIMVALFLLLFFKVGGNLLHIFSEDMNSQGAKYVSTLANQVYLLKGADKGDGLDNSISIHEEDLFMFFSAGNAPIRLVRNDLGVDKSLIFERPTVEECDGKACICHCGAGHYWEETGGQLTFFISLGKPYTCPEAFLTCQAVDDKIAVFGNSRGYGDDFYKSVLKETIRLKKENDLYYPIPFDLVLLGQTSSNGELSRSYSVVKQANEKVEDLTTKYHWEDGVVIGGTATINKKEKKTIDTVQAIIHMEKSFKYDGVYGVCLHSECFPAESDPKDLFNRRNLMESVDLALSSVETQQQGILEDISINCISTSSSYQAAACERQLSRLGPYPLPVSAPLLNTPLPWTEQALYLLEFSLEKAGTWTITPQVIITSSCDDLDNIEVIKKESFILYGTLAFPEITSSADSTPGTLNNFFVVDNVLLNNQETSSKLYITEKSVEDICTAIGTGIPNQTETQSLGQAFKPSIKEQSGPPPSRILLLTLVSKSFESVQ